MRFPATPGWGPLAAVVCGVRRWSCPGWSSGGYPAARIYEGGEAGSGADGVLADADVFGGEAVEGERQAFPDCFQEEPGGVREGSLDIKGGDDEVERIHVGDGVLEEDGLVWRPARDSPPEAGRYVGVQVWTDAAQEDGPDDLDLHNATNYVAPVVRLGPVPPFADGVDNAGPVRC